jgi:hypothetical protein
MSERLRRLAEAGDEEARAELEREQDREEGATLRCLDARTGETVVLTRTQARRLGQRDAGTGFRSRHVPRLAEARDIIDGLPGLVMRYEPPEASEWADVCCEGCDELHDECTCEDE